MELTDAQYAQLSPLLPVQRGNVKIKNRQLLHALLYITENGCKWRRLPKAYGNWHTIYTRLRLPAAGRPLGGQGCSGTDFRGTSGTTVDCDPCGMYWFGQYQRQSSPGCHGSSKKNGPQAIGKSRGGWNTKVHLASADDRTALRVHLSPGQAGDGVEGRALLENWNEKPKGLPDNLAMVMDKAYEGEETRASVARAGFIPVVPPKTNRRKPWKYDRELYKRRNEVERLFRKLKAFRRIYTRFDLPAAGRETRHYVHGVCVPRTHPDYYLALTRPNSAPQMAALVSVSPPRIMVSTTPASRFGAWSS